MATNDELFAVYKILHQQPAFAQSLPFSKLILYLESEHNISVGRSTLKSVFTSLGYKPYIQRGSSKSSPNNTRQLAKIVRRYFAHVGYENADDLQLLSDIIGGRKLPSD